MIEIFGWIIACFVAGVTVSIHYETMLLTSDRVIPWAQHHWPGRRVMILCMLSLFLGHFVEIWLFAIVLKVLLHINGIGSLTGAFDSDLHAFLYYSAANYTSIGDSDIHSHGAIRAVIFSETLTGLMMIAWSASFTYLKMEQIWGAMRQNHLTSKS
jgi:hypothetical protein